MADAKKAADYARQNAKKNQLGIVPDMSQMHYSMEDFHLLDNHLHIYIELTIF